MLGLRTVTCLVNDLDAAKKWYSKAFGVEPYFDEPFYVGFNIGGYELGLQPEEGDARTKAESVVAYWGVSDINAEFERLVSLGGISFEEPTDVGHDIKIAKLRDPWDNIIGLIYNPHFKMEEAR